MRIADLLRATSLPFIATASEIGVALGVIEPGTSAALIFAGLLSVVLFPPLALARLPHHRRSTTACCNDEQD